MTNHRELIDALCRSAVPVRRPACPTVRALAWASICVAAGFVAVSPMRHAFSPIGGSGDLISLVALAAGLITGLSALLAAFHMSIAGRRATGLLLSLFAATLWFALNIAEIAQLHWTLGSLGEGIYCFSFITLCSVPMLVSLVIALRRTRSLQPNRTLKVAGLGMAALSASLLAFCHPFHLDVMDFGMHVMAMGLVIAVAAKLGPAWISVAPAKA